MKNKIKNIYAGLQNFVITEKFLIVFLLLIVNNVYALLDGGIDSQDYILSVFYSMTKDFYIVILLFVVLVTIYTTIHNFDKNYNVILRCDNKMTYYRYLIKRVMINTAFVYFINLIMLFLVMNLGWSGASGIGYISYYHVNSLIYLGFHIIKVFLIVELLAIFFVNVVKIFGMKISYLINCITVFSSFLMPMFFSRIMNEIILRVFFFEYLSIFSFNNFMNEILWLIGFIFGSVLILKGMKFLVMKENKDIEI